MIFVIDCQLMMKLLVFGLMVLAASVVSSESEKEEPVEHYNIVLLGATGDLAAKYLWSGKNC